MLQQARASLALARETPARTRGELAVARARDAQMRTELAEAVEELRRAREELLRGWARVADQETVLGQVAVESYQSGDPDLLALPMVLNSQDTAELSFRGGVRHTGPGRRGRTRHRRLLPRRLRQPGHRRPRLPPRSRARDLLQPPERYSTYVGQRVQRGEVIGFVGSTGASTGCQLHFMVFEDGATVNPIGWL